MAGRRPRYRFTGLTTHQISATNLMWDFLRPTRCSSPARRHRRRLAGLSSLSVATRPGAACREDRLSRPLSRRRSRWGWLAFCSREPAGHSATLNQGWLDPSICVRLNDEGQHAAR